MKLIAIKTISGLKRLRDVTETQATQIEILQTNNKELQADKEELLNRIKYLDGKLRITLADNNLYTEEIMRLNKKIAKLEKHRNTLLELLSLNKNLLEGK